MQRSVLLLAIFFIAFIEGASPAVFAKSPSRRSLAAKDRRIRVVVANQAGAVWVRRADGTVQKFPSADNDVARGAALAGAFALGTELRNSTVFLGPGTYVIPAALRGWNGTKLWGSGKDATLIKLADGALGSSYFTFRTVESEDPLTGYRYCNNCELRDLTIDANRQNQLPGSFFGVGAAMIGSHSTMSNVRCRNAGGNTPQEVFCLSCGGGGGVGGTFNTGMVKNLLIENCEVDGVAPGFASIPIAITAIALNGGSAPSATVPGDGWAVNGRITGCSVHGVTAPSGLIGFQISWASRCIVENCSVYGNTGRYIAGFYSDTGSLQNLSVSHNQFSQVDAGARILCDSDSYHTGTLIFANDVLTQTVVNGAGKAGIEYSGSHHTSGVRVLGNRIRLEAPVAGSICVGFADLNAAFILGNTIDNFGLAVGLHDAGDTVVRGNTDSNGVAMGAGAGRQVP